MSDPRREDLRRIYPNRAVILKNNDYGLPVGKQFLFARKREGVTIWPIEILGEEVYTLTEEEAALLPAEGDAD